VKSLQVPFGFYPDVVGGTEIYVAALAAALSRLGHPATIAAPGPRDDAYFHGSQAVRRFAVSEHVGDVAELYDLGDADAAERFGFLLDRERPDVVHLHAFTRSCSVRLVRAARDRQIPVVFTYHTPTVSCVRGTLMLWGSEPCDGAMAGDRCASCALEGRGVPKSFAQILGRLPAIDLEWSASLKGKWSTALKFSALVANRHEATRTLFAEVDRIVALRDWISDLLIANGVPVGKIVQSRHALCHEFTRPTRHGHSPGPIRLAFMGRLDPTKGADILIAAVKQIPASHLTLDLYCAVQAESNRRELARLKQMAGDDPRIKFHPALDSARVVETLARFGALVVPSQWLETGPLVILEAFAAGTPVLGSALGGIAELITDGVNGLLVRDYRSPAAWAAALKRLASDFTLLKTLESHVVAPRGMGDVAAEMIGLYAALAPTSSRTTPTISSVA
jgi:glycosyltransferase involved in cell wall biosynthesis